MSKGTIMVVDDTPESLKLLADTLTAEGYRIRPADGGKLALASARANPPELILLDIRMPDIDGFEVCRLLKAQPETSEIPIVFISAATEIEERVEGLRLGAVDFISKPYRREELLVRIQTHLDLSRLRSHLERLVADRTAELNDANEQLRNAAAFQRTFLRDLLTSVTDGGLVLCHTHDDLPSPLTLVGAPIALSAELGLRELREVTRAAAARIELSRERTDDLVTAANEAGMNSVVHVGSGVGRVFVDEDAGKVQVRIDDEGPGIALNELPKATLRKGYSTAGTFGHGMKMMLYMVDHVYLLTGPTGTNVVLEEGQAQADET